MASTFNVVQTIFPGHTEKIIANALYEDQLSQRILDRFLASVVDGKIGLAPTYDEQQRLKSIAFASQGQVLIINFSAKTRSPSPKRELLMTRVFMDASLKKYAFHMDKLSTSIFLDLSLRMKAAVDILSLLPRGRYLILTKVLALGGEPKVDKESVARLFREDESSTAEPTVVATQAWAAYKAALAQPASTSPSIIDTTTFSIEELHFLAKTIRDAEQFKNLKPIIVRNEIEDKYEVRKDGLTVQSSRYKTKIMRPGSNQTIQVEVTHNGRTSTLRGNLRGLKGKTAQLNVSGASRADKLIIRTIGREDPTAAEAVRANTMLEVLQNTNTLLTLPFVQDIWFPKKAKMPVSKKPSNLIPITFTERTLNKSQKLAVDAILSDKPSKRVILIQGPPGTGKTTVIAAAVVSIMASGNGQNVWLVAQSNVAVKNIAEKLADVGFLDFKLLVSKDFHFEWHEHLYTEMENNVIRSDDFPHSRLPAERLLKGSRVVLCTLSMLSNDRLAVFTHVVPPGLFIFDEASQIEVGDYVPMLHRYQKTTRKLVFIGDDKQLPPYGQGDIDGLQSVFELPHLRQRALFLDTQYRMPLPIGNFISKQVYQNRLKTEHSIRENSCCRFIDVSYGREVSRGRSWINEKQAQIVVALARKMQVLNYSYRIITPYDAQRSLIETDMKKENDLKWQDKVFNVDSFQGNEDDFIIISLVRTNRVGFLRELRRVNVMLTRCRKGMIICTDRAFIHGVASSSPVASLAKALGNDVWVPWNKVLQPSYRPFPA